MKKILVTALCLVTLSAYAQSPVPTLTPEQVEAAKKRAAGISAIANSQSAAFTPNGEIALEQNGRVKSGGMGSTDIAAQGKYFNSMSGVGGYESSGIGDRSKNVSVQVKGSSFADFSCKLLPGAQKTILGRVIRYNGCEVSTEGTIASISLSMCSVTLNGGACRPEDYSQVQALSVGQFSTMEGLKVGVGCNETNKTCRVTLQDTYSLASDRNDLEGTAAKKVANLGQNSAQNMASQRYTSNAYTQQLRDAKDIKACTAEAQTTADRAGVAATCGAYGRDVQTVQVGPVATNPSCSDTPVCVRRATRQVTYGQTCVRTFPLTGYSCNYTVPKYECSVTKELASGKMSNSCLPEDIDGGVKVKTTEESATCVESDAAGSCVKQSWTEYYTQPSKASIDGDCSSSPSPISGSPAEACLNRGAGVSGGTTCREGGWWQRTLTESECTTIQVQSAGEGRTIETITSLTEAEKAGCGVCVSTKTNDTCYARPTEAQDSCANIDFSSCTLTSSSPESQLEGMTISQKDVYSCTKEEETCAEYDRSNACTNTDMTFGVGAMAGDQTVGTGTFNRAMTTAAVAESIAQGTQEARDGSVIPQVFAGTDSRCEKAVGFIGSALSNDCCKLNLDRPGGEKIGNQCMPNEAKLAAARRANFTVFIGEYCSKQVRVGFIKSCTKRTQTYCAYPGLLPRLIQEQGRDQLKMLATSSAAGSIQKSTMNFQFYHAAGGWGPISTTNGVSVTPWQYPGYCATAEQAGEELSKNPSARSCPLSLSQWIAVCEKPGGCGALPDTPELGSQHWQLSLVNPLKNTTTAVSKYAVVTGACDPASGNCQYEVSAWPAGVGGRAVASADVSFPLYVSTEADGRGFEGALGDYIFRPVPIVGVAAPGAPLPATVRIDVSLNAGSTFASMTVPTTIRNTDVAVPGAPEVRVTGGCDAAMNSCKFVVTGTVTVTAKSWGSAENPDCSGFSLGQLAVLDFDKMDLSEWVASITGKADGSGAGTLADRAASQGAQMANSGLQGGGVSSHAQSQELRAASITPAEDFGPFTATLRVSGNYPVFHPNPADNTDPVSHVEVDWGDCGGGTEVVPRLNETVNGIAADGFMARHRYAAPNQVPAACGGSLPHNQQRSIEHAVKVRIHSRSGVHESNLKVINTWNTYSR